MPVITLRFDLKASQNMMRLKEFFNASSDADIIQKGLALLSAVRDVTQSKGKLVAMRGEQQTELLVR
jgi:hypothetical protein